MGTCTICSASGASSAAGNTCASSGFYYPSGSTGTAFTNCNSTWGAGLSAGVATCNANGALSCVPGYYLSLSTNVNTGLFCLQCAVTTPTANNYFSCSVGG